MVQIYKTYASQTVANGESFAVSQNYFSDFILSCNGPKKRARESEEEYISRYN